MAIFKRGRVYWYHFYFNSQHVQRSTKQGNPRVARQMEAAHRTALAKGDVGIFEREPAPTLLEFMHKEFMPWVVATFTAKPKSSSWYRGGVRRLTEFEPLSKLRMDQITGEKMSAYVARRQRDGLNVTSINRELQILRRIMKLAVEWGRIELGIKIKMLPGELRRERVLGLSEEKKYLEAAMEPLRSIATVLIDSGVRPEEGFRLRWENINWGTGKYGTMLIPHGKTPSARRVLPMTPRVRFVLESIWNKSGKLREGYVFTAPTMSGHVEPSTIRLQHRRAVKLAELRPFVLYTLRHTFLTRLGESGCDPWTLARIAGHSTISISARYVHPSDEAVLSAMSRVQMSQQTEENAANCSLANLPAL